jgi:hypothetical protein
LRKLSMVAASWLREAFIFDLRVMVFSVDILPSIELPW